MTTEPTSTIDTAFGLAHFTVSADGLLHLAWREGLTINRVQYGSGANSYQEQHRNFRGESTHISTHVYLSRVQGIKEPSAAAVSAVRHEAQRLAGLLVTGEAVACARVWAAEQTIKRAERQQAEAEEAHARARAEHDAACQALRALDAV